MVKPDENYVERILKKDRATIIREGIISQSALDSLMRGIEFKRSGNLGGAAKALGMAWAFNSLQEYSEGINLCDKLMRVYGFSPEDISAAHEHGNSTSRKLLHYLTAVTILTRGYDTNLIRKEDIEELPIKRNDDGTYTLEFRG